MPIRVLHMIGSLNIGGSQAMILSLYKRINRNKVQFDFIIDHPEQLYYAKEVQELGGRLFFMPTFKGNNVIEIKKAWNKFFVEHPEYKILHSHVRSYASVYLPIAKKYNVYTIIHSHSTSNGEGFEAIVKTILQIPLRFQADYYMACSEAAGKWLFGTKIVKANNFRVIPNAIDVERYCFDEEKRNEIRSELGISDKLVIGNVGRFIRQKNHLFLLEVFAKICEKKDNSVLLLIGDGDLKPIIEDRIRELSLTDHVIILGYKDNTHDYYQAMDVFVFPSISEGLGIVAIEAQTSGLPCVVSERIPTEININAGLINVLRLVDGPDKWSETILNVKIDNRQGKPQETRNAGYDITNNALEMQNFYYKVYESL